MKTIDVSGMSDKERNGVLQESRLLEALSHPNIVRFIEVFKTNQARICIVMDYADGNNFKILVYFVQVAT